MRHVRTLVASLVVAAGLLWATASDATPPLPPPGTAAQVAQLVKASTAIKKLPADLQPALAAAPNDSASTLYPKTANGCSTTTACVYGDLNSSTVVVLYGDSHAQMWLPAFVPIANSLAFKLVLLWHAGCPIEDFATANVTCEHYRTTDIGLINALKPTLVLLSNKVTDIVGPGGVIYTNAQWLHGLEVTIEALQSPATSVAVLGDVNQFDESVPDCLSIHPSNVQDCAIANPNPKYTQHFAQEAQAAAATKAGYVNPMAWFCTKKCSPVIGTMVVDYDQGHVTATYAEYLTTVWSTAISKLLS